MAHRAATTIGALIAMGTTLANGTQASATVPRLPRGPHTLSREQVAANQRERLTRAMVERVGEKGYVATTVSEVARHAGVSRKAFYEHFSSKEHCFLAAYDQLLAEGLDDTSRAAKAAQRDDAEDGRPEELARSLETLFGRAIRNRAGARLVLIEISALGPAGLERREQLVGSYEALLRQGAGVKARPGIIPNPLLRALVGGFLKVACARVQKGRTGQLRTLVPDLVSWARSYTPVPDALTTASALDPSRLAGLVGGRAPGTLAPSSTSDRRRSPGQRTPSFSRSFVAHSQRERILDAVALLSAEKGYAGLTLEDIAEHASVSMQAFYEHFSDKQDAFLVAYEVGHSKALAMVERAHDVASDWPSGVRAGIGALYEFLASEPAFARLSLVDALVATPRTAERVSKGMTRYGDLLAEGAVSPTSLVLEAISGGIFELCLAYAVKDRIAALPELVPWTTYFALAPFVGPEVAGKVAMEGVA